MYVCVMGINVASLKWNTLYQARKLSGHVCVCYGYQYYLFKMQCIVPSQDIERPCMCVLWISMLPLLTCNTLYLARKLRGHVCVCYGYQYYLFKMQCIVPSQDIERPCMCVLWVSMLPVLTCNTLYLARKLRGHVCVCYGYQCCLFLRLFYWIMEFFRRCVILLFTLVYSSASRKVTGNVFVC